MFQKILLPVDGTELSERAVQAGIELAKKLGASITAFVAEPLPPLPTMGTNPTLYARESEEHLARTEEHARKLLARIAGMAGEQGVSCEGKYQRSDSVDDSIVSAASEFSCDLIVMATHGRGAFGELLFGSHTKNVLARSKVPLLVLH